MAAEKRGDSEKRTNLMRLLGRYFEPNLPNFDKPNAVLAVAIYATTTAITSCANTVLAKSFHDGLFSAKACLLANFSIILVLSLLIQYRSLAVVHLSHVANYAVLGLHIWLGLRSGTPVGSTRLFSDFDLIACNISLFINGFLGFICTNLCRSEICVSWTQQRPKLEKVHFIKSNLNLV